MSRSFRVPEPLPLAEQRGQTFSSLVELMGRLLAPDGCPWDREQDYRSLRQYVLEEACEVIDAIDRAKPAELVDELGDLSLQVVFLAELGRRDGAFGPDDVVRAICEKLVRRHPHVFGDVTVADAGDVVRNWDAMVARVGFDWPDAQGSRDKVEEELGELDEAVKGGDRAHIRAELGDLLFALVNFARHHGVDPEEALRETADRFRSRFDHVERRIKEKHGDWPRDEHGKPTTGLSLEEMDGYWNEAKEQGT
jgi:uncharacterized protein YabN with tetrapyrrole methylase and pyrophosphatase domain